VEVPDLRVARVAGNRSEPGVGQSVFRGLCPRFAKGKLVPIVLISESLLRRSSAVDGRVLRDRLLTACASHDLPIDDRQQQNRLSRFFR